MDDTHDLELLLRSRIPLIIIETGDEKRVVSLFARLAISLAMPVMAWSATTGLQRIDYDAVPQRHASEPRQALGQIKATGTPGIYLLMDFHPYLEDAYNIRLLKEIALEYATLGHTLVLVSVQGGGKSLAAKAVAGMWSIPLLRFDFGTLYNKFHGETERNLREALQTAEAMSPCVLWIDEIEKAIASGDNDGGTSRRMLGTLLTWMAERTAPVFIVATANVIEHLPPELIRKGRLDEIFFVDLPDAATRAEIFAIHLRKREHKPVDFDILALTGITEGFTGAEIEQSIVAATYLAREQGVAINTEHIRTEIEQTRPLSLVMAEKMARLRAWARERTVPAN